MAITLGTGTREDPFIMFSWDDFEYVIDNYTNCDKYARFAEHTVIDMNDIYPLGVNRVYNIKCNIDGNGAIIKNFSTAYSEIFRVEYDAMRKNIRALWNIIFENMAVINTSLFYIYNNTTPIEPTCPVFFNIIMIGSMNDSDLVWGNASNLYGLPSTGYLFQGCSFTFKGSNNTFISWNANNNTLDCMWCRWYDCVFNLEFENRTGSSYNSPNKNFIYMIKDGVWAAFSRCVFLGKLNGTSCKSLERVCFSACIFNMEWNDITISLRNSDNCCVNTDLIPENKLTLFAEKGNFTVNSTQLADSEYMGNKGYVIGADE